MRKKILILLILPFVFLACKENSLNLKICFNQVQGLKHGNRVIFEQNHIGSVKRLFYSDEGISNGSLEEVINSGTWEEYISDGYYEYLCDDCDEDW